MKQIIIVIHTLAVGGAERRISTLADYIARQGHKVTILLIDNPVVDFPINPDIEVVCINRTPPLNGYNRKKCSLFKPGKTFKTSFSDNINLRKARIKGDESAEFAETELFIKYKYALPLYEYLKQFPDAIIISFMTVPNISLMMAAQNLKNRVIFGDCTDVANEYPQDSPYNDLRKKYYSRADAALFQTDAQSSCYSFLPDLNKTVIPNFIKSDALPERCEVKRRKEIVNFCHLTKAKNLPLLIDAFALLNKNYPEYTLSIYGEGSLKESLLEQIASLNLEERVFIRDFDLNIHSKIVDCAMFVSSSDREGISNSMLEAMAVGLPCVCTDCLGGGARMMIEDGENGLLVPMKDANALCLAMKKIIENPALAEKLSQNAVKIRERLEPEKICGQMLSAILGE